MKKITLILAAFLMFLLNVNAQNSEKEKAENYLAKQGELTFTFQIENGNDLERLTRDMSLINYDPSTKMVKAWANETQFRRFETSNIPYNVPKNENEVDESVIYDVRPLAYRSAAATLTFPVNSYPTYAEYAQQMQDFEDDYPALVEKSSIGFTGQGDKELLFVKISDNVSMDEKEPKLMLTSSMHGDEIAGYPMMLSLIDYILTVYSNTGHADHARVKNLVENTELWINPSANPDGTYHNSATNTSVVNSRRGNGNNIDLNRNYPDNVAGPHDDGNAYQTETIAFMNFADAHDFVLSSNFHGGTELVNYPFDNAYSAQHVHADNDWFEHIGVEYATHCQTDANAGGSSAPTYTNKASYMTDDDDWDENAGNQAWHNDYAQSPGVTHGAEWYRVYGGRQDYMNFYQQCREITIELSDVKILPESSLVDYWYYNRDALLDFLTQGTYGFRGEVVDVNTTNPIEDVKVTIVSHDAYGSEVYTDTGGDYYRPIKAGTYDLLFEAPCYQPITVTAQTITDGNTVVLSDVQLAPLASVPTGLGTTNVSTTSATLNWDVISGMTYGLRYREVGTPSWTTTTVAVATFQLTGLTALTQYEFQVRSDCGSFNSAYSSSELFTTTGVVACAGTLISSYPYLETFDSGLGDWIQNSGDDGDWSLDANGTQSTGTGPSDDITGSGNYLYTEASTSGLDANATVLLTSPCYDLTSLPDGYFSFYYHMLGDNVGTLNLEVTSDNGDNWVNIFTESGSLGDVWNFENIDLSGYYGQVVKFRFTGITGDGWSSDIAIDHIGLGGPIPDTEVPVITLNGASTIDLNVGSTYVELGATATDNVDGDLTSSIIIGGDTVNPNVIGVYVVTYNVSDAASNAAVEVTRTVNIVQGIYCDSSGTTQYETGVTRVLFGTIDNSDGSPKDIGYEDFTNISTDVTQGTNVDLTVQVDTDGDYTVHAFVWIDWNQNSDFDDPGEEYDLGDITDVEDGALPTLVITIPESFNFGNTRMRVSAQYDANPTSCLENFDGEVEDYTVNVKYDGLLYSGGTWDPSAPDGTTTSDNVLILDGIYDVNSADISINDLIVNSSATITIDKAFNATIAGNIDVMNNGEFILNSDSNEFSSLIVDGTVTGDVKYNRHVTSNAGGNDLISPPVSGESFTSFISNNSNIFANSGQTLYLFGPFEKPLNDYGLFSSAETTTLDVAKGYRAASTDDGTFTFKGVVTTGSLNVPIIKTGTDFAKWNLVGNPYTSYIKLADFLTANLNELDPNTVAVYGYDADLTYGTEWTIWNMAYSDNNPGSLIAPGQGFFVSSKDGGSNVIFNPSMQTIGTSDDFIIGRNTNLAHFVITMSKPGRAYNTDIYFKDNTTLGLNIGYDAELFTEEPSSFSIYSELTEDGQDLNMAIQTIGFNDVNGSTVIPVGINLLQGEQVTISMETSEMNYDVYFEDIFTNTTILLNTSDYNLTANTDLLGTGRFYIRFEPETLSVVDSDLNDIQIYNNSDLKQIIVNGQLTKDTSFVLYDIQGREIIRTNLDTTNIVNTIDASNCSNGVYVVQLTNKLGTISKKLIIK
ncbi:M14 family zinc carboxypeptidase [Psychroserpens ponticola]|uniref:M14 family zinc carboxypeptidase n=1 Tax=Psychroserpens ponticola TaxID=2932268 RepID=A0ABY7S0Z8_9FLAO|nr:M14 family zinc carboxypeptidase [Psychroserpens ponticola]WCO01590.1 M14 family zinc carboxypeptidase [Psychroserpens ponticola]